MKTKRLLGGFLTTLACVVVASLVHAQPSKANDAALTKDVDYVAAQMKKWNQKSVARTTFLGWTANNDAVVRFLHCDEGEGRGPFCELKVCLAKSTATGPVPELDCKAGVSVELGPTEPALASANSPQLLSAATNAFAPIGKGTSLQASSVRLAFRDFASTIKTKSTGPIVLFAATENEYGASGVVSAKITSVAESQDKRCIATIGVAQRSVHREKKKTMASPLAAVVCKPARSAEFPTGMKGALPVVLGVSVGPLKLGMNATEVSALGFIAKKLPTDLGPTRMVVTQGFELVFDDKDKLTSIQLDLTNYPEGIVVNGKTFDKRSTEAELLKAVPGCGKVADGDGGGSATCASNTFVGHAGPINLVTFRIRAGT